MSPRVVCLAISCVMLCCALLCCQGDIEARLSAAAHRMLDAFETLLTQLLQPASTPAAPAATSPTSSPTPASAAPSPLNQSMTRYVHTSAADSKPVARALFPAAGGAFGQGGANSFTAPSNAASTPSSTPATGSSSTQGQSAPQSSLASLLVSFDDSWVEYLDQFVVWKGRDAVGLEQELMRMAVRLERSMRLKLGRREVDSPEVKANPDLQVRRDRAGSRKEPCRAVHASTTSLGLLS